MVVDPLLNVEINRENMNKFEITPQTASNWEELIKPSKFIEEFLDTNSAKIVLSPLERGFGVTLGNALRRVLLSSLQGAAITSVKIYGVLHEFSNIPGVSEDVVEVILNIKSICIQMTDIKKKILHLNVKGPCIVTAGMIKEVGGIQIINPDHVICTLSADSELEIEFLCEVGKGYVPIMRSEELPSGTILLDALYSPIKNVSFHVDTTRVGKVTDYDKLTINIETNGTVSPSLAIALAAKILQNQLQLFVTFENEEIKYDIPKEDSLLNPILFKKIDELELSTRPHHCIKNDNIVFIGDLVTRTEAEMLQLPNFGKKSLNELKEILSGFGLHFGMEIKGWSSGKEEISNDYINTTY